jgi:hypothetical protein
MELEISVHIFEKYWNIKFHEKPSSIGNRVVPYGQIDGQTDMTKLLVAFRNFANVPKKGRTWAERSQTNWVSKSLCHSTETL